MYFTINLLKIIFLLCICDAIPTIDFFRKLMENRFHNSPTSQGPEGNSMAEPHNEEAKPLFEVPSWTCKKYTLFVHSACKYNF